MARTKRLGVWLDGERIADLEQRGWPEVRCRYLAPALDRWPLNSPVISCALPLQAGPQDALAFCKGLLPEGQALQTLAARAGVAANDTFALLRRYGRDVAGALVIAEEAPDPGPGDVEPYTEEGLAAAVEELDEFPLGAHDDSELSLAGLQDKLLLVRLGDGRWGRPLHGRPSTHILKVDDPRHPGLVAAERECLALAGAAGLTTIDHELAVLGDRPCLIVSRFDREATGEGLRRVHQEDLCQATGIDPEEARGRAKYERAGGPGLRDAARLLDAYAADPAGELDRLAAIATFTVLIGNAGAHGKNVALLHPEPERVTLAPLYDTVPTVLWPRLRTEAAMRVAGEASMPAITLEHLVEEARGWPHAARRAERSARATIAAVLDALDRGVLPPDSAVAAHVRERARALAG